MTLPARNGQFTSDGTKHKALYYEVLMDHELSHPKKQMHLGRPAPNNVAGREFPKIHDDLRVTFRVKTPDAQKVHVAPRGDHNSLGGGPYDMHRDSTSVRTVTTPPVGPGFHDYQPVDYPLNIVPNAPEPLQHLLHDAFFLLVWRFFSWCHFEGTTKKGFLSFAVGVRNLPFLACRTSNAHPPAHQRPPC